uniref:Uncharacterized protein n=1 Tax=Romanomermis culicivorax TaxID=13658 RepID=A0A915KQS8_ROMCU
MIGSHQISEPRPTESALLHENGSNNNETDVALTSPPPMSANALNNVCLAVRFIRFGTYCTVPYKEGLVMESSCLILTVKEDSSVYANFPCTTQADSTSAPHLVTSRPYAFKIGWHNVRRFEFHVHANCSVIYLLMSDNCAKKIRETFGLNEQFVHDFRLPFYDPGSNEQGRKYVTIGLSECRVSWIDIVRKYIYKVNPQAEVVALTYKEAMDRMRKSAPAVRNVLPHQPHRAGLGQQQQQIVQKSTSPPILNTFVQRHANGDGGNVANIGVPVYQIQSPVVRQVPLVPIQIQQYAVANVFYQPANFVTSRAINNNNINASINNPIVNVNRATNMTYSEAYSKVQKGLMNDHSSPQKQQQYCQQDASTSTSIDMAESPVMQSSFGQQICNLTATTATVTTPSTTSKHFLQNIVLKVFKKIRNNDGTEIPVVPRATAPVDVSWPQLEIRRQQVRRRIAWYLYG